MSTTLGAVVWGSFVCPVTISIAKRQQKVRKRFICLMFATIIIVKKIAPTIKIGAIRLSAIRIIYFLTILKKTTTSLCVKSVFNITS